MVSIGIAALAPLVFGTCADRDFWLDQQNRIARLEQIRDQQAELLERAEQPGVVEKAAIHHLRYRPSGSPREAIRSVPESWPQLERALEQLDLTGQAPQSSSVMKTYSETLIECPRTRLYLLGMGGILLLVSLTCFLRR